MIQELIFIILFEFPKIEKIFMMAQNGYIEYNEKKLSQEVLLTERYRFLTISFSLCQFFRKTDNSICFLKTTGKVKGKALGIIQLTIAGKFPAALFFSPDFAAGKQLTGDAFLAVIFQYKDALQISNWAV